MEVLFSLLSRWSRLHANCCAWVCNVACLYFLLVPILAQLSINVLFAKNGNHSDKTCILYVQTKFLPRETKSKMKLLMYVQKSNYKTHLGQNSLEVGIISGSISEQSSCSQHPQLQAIQFRPLASATSS